MDKVYFRLMILLTVIILNFNNTLASEYGTIEGIVIDSVTLNSIPYATIELLVSSDSTFVRGTTSDTTGRFVFNELAFGNYLLRISFLGYKKKIVPNLEITSENYILKIGSIKLYQEIKQLSEVSIVGQKLSGVIKGNRTIYQIKDESAEIAQSGLELLRQLPDVTVSHFTDEVKLAGRNNILFQVNGRKVDNNYLMQLNPSLIDKIEVINNPSTEYELETDAVINIILKRQFQKGMSGGVVLNSSTSGKALMSKNNANIDYYLNKFRFYVAGNYKYRNYDIETSNERNVISPEASYLKQKTCGSEKGNSLGMNYGMDWFMNEKNILSIFSSFQPATKNEISTTTDNYFSNSEKEQYSTGFSTTSDTKYFYDYSLFYNHGFSKKSHKISFEAYGSNRTDENSNEFNEYPDINATILSSSQNQFIENTNRYMYLKMHYVYPISEHVNLSTGYNNYLLSRDYHYNDLLSDYSDKINYKEIRHAAYLNLSTDIYNFNIQSGIRYENSNTDITHKEDTINHYHFLSPSLTITYKTESAGIFRLSYRRSIERPGINQLSPAIYVHDSYTQSSGNPNLNPSTIDRIELEHRIPFKNSMYINYKPYLSFTKDGIRQVKIFESDSLEIRRYSNVSNQMEYGINVSGSLSINKIWTVAPSITWYYRNLKALPEYGITSDLRDNSWRINLSSQLVLPKKWILFLEYNYEAPTIDYQFKKYAYYDFAFGFVKLINKKLSIAAFTLNPWSNQYVYDKRSYATENSNQLISNSIKYNYLVFVKLNYKFKSGKTGKKADTDIEQEKIQEINKGIFD